MVKIKAFERNTRSISVSRMEMFLVFLIIKESGVILLEVRGHMLDKLLCDLRRAPAFGPVNGEISNRLVGEVEQRESVIQAAQHGGIGGQANNIFISDDVRAACIFALEMDVGGETCLCAQGFAVLAERTADGKSELLVFEVIQIDHSL